MLARGYACIALLVTTCSASAGAAASPTPDRTQAYIALVHS